MGFYKFIKIKGKDANRIGYYVPHLFKLVWCLNVLKIFGFQYVKERLAGWTIWWVVDEEDYVRAIKTLNELKKTYSFEFRVSK